jgi:WD40 repeat protein
MNQARDMVSFKGTAFSNEWVLARVSAKGLQTVEPSGVERWRFHYSPQLSPSGRYAWGLHGLYETKGGVEVREFDRSGFSWNRGSVWIGDSTILELATRSKMNEDESEGFNECALVLWDVESGRMLRNVPESRARTLCVSPDVQSVAEGTLDGRLVIRSASTLEIQQEYKVHDAEVTRTCWHPTKPVIVTTSKDFTAKVWDVRDGSLLATYRFVSIPFQVDISRKGDLIAVGGISRVDVLRLDLSGLRD